MPIESENCVGVEQEERIEHRVRGVLEHVRQNIADYITIALGIFFGILGLTGAVSLEIVTAGILAVLAFLSLSNVGERRRELELQRQVEKLIQITDQGTTITAESFFYEAHVPDELELLKKARQEICLMEAIPYSTLRTSFEFLNEAMARGVKVRWIRCEHNQTLLRESCFRAAHRRNLNSAQLEYKMADQLFSDLRKNLSRPDLLELRDIPCVPPYSVFFYDPEDRDHGVAVITLAGFWVRWTDRPIGRHIFIGRKTDPRLYQRYFDEFTMLWQWKP